MSKVKAGEVATWVTERAIQIPRRQRLHARVPRCGAHAPRREDLRHLRGHGGDQRLVISRAISGVQIR